MSRKRRPSRPSSASALAQARARAASTTSIGSGSGDRCSERDLVTGDRERCERRELVGPGERIVECAEPMDAAEAVEPLGGVGLCAEQHRTGDRRRELVGEPPNRPVIDDESELRRGHTDHAVRGRDPEVGGDGELGARRRAPARRSPRSPGTGIVPKPRSTAARSAVNWPCSTPVRSAPALNAGAAPVSTTTTRAVAPAARDALDGEQFEQRLVIDGVSSRRPVEREQQHRTGYAHGPRRCTVIGRPRGSDGRGARSMSRLYVGS